MTVLHHTIDISAPPERVWSILADLVAVERYNPTVTAARWVGERRAGIGATRECDLDPPSLVRERVIAWEDGAAVGLEVIASDWPIVFMRWTTRLTPTPAGTRVSQDLEYQLKFGPVGWLLDHLVMRRRLDAGIAEVFQGLKRHVEADREAR